MEFNNFILVAVYVPMAGEKLWRLDYRTKEWDVDLHNYLKHLEKSKGKPVVLSGDLNVAHKTLDVYNP